MYETILLTSTSAHLGNVSRPELLFYICFDVMLRSGGLEQTVALFI